MRCPVCLPNVTPAPESCLKRAFFSLASLHCLFSRLIALSEVVISAHFVFYGPNQPMPKPGQEVKAAPLLLVQRFQDMLTAFGFSWHVVGHTKT